MVHDVPAANFAHVHQFFFPEDHRSTDTEAATALVALLHKAEKPTVNLREFLQRVAHDPTPDVALTDNITHLLHGLRGGYANLNGGCRQEQVNAHDTTNDLRYFRGIRQADR